jgi:hypothetical protein
MTFPTARACVRTVVKVAAEAGARQRVGVTAFGEQPDATDGREDEAVQEPVGDLDGGGVTA